MKILHVGCLRIHGSLDREGDSYDLYPGLGVDGPTRSLLGLALSISENGIETGILSTKPVSHQKRFSPEKIVYLADFMVHKYNPFYNTDLWISRILEQFGKPDLIDFHDVYVFFYGALSKALKKRGWKYIVTPRGSLRHFALKQSRIKKKLCNYYFANRFLRDAEMIHALTEQEALEIKNFNPDFRIDIVPNGLPTRILELYKKVADSKDKMPVSLPKEWSIFFLGQVLVDIKGIDILIDAVGRYQRQTGDKFLKVIIAGPINTNKDEARIDKLLSKLPFPDKVVLPGTTLGKDKWDLFAGSDVFVLPSRTEGMPVVVLEAMACAKPCLLSKGTNMASLIEKTQSGWGFDGTSEDLCKKLITISRVSREKLEHFGMNGQRYFEQHYTYNVVSRQYIKMVRSICHPN